ncbi:MAG: zinc ribbon domain-containing protein [Planctomycetota bacterium]
MPLYEFTCKSCLAEFELLVRSENDKLECPECNSDGLERKLSIFSSPNQSTSHSSSGSQDCNPSPFGGG